MSDLKISELPVTQPLTGDELIPMVQGAGNDSLETRKATLTQIRDFNATVIPAANTAFVETTGDDATAQIGNRARPFKTAGAAYTAVLHGEHTAYIDGNIMSIVEVPGVGFYAACSDNRLYFSATGKQYLPITGILDTNATTIKLFYSPTLNRVLFGFGYYDYTFSIGTVKIYALDPATNAGTWLSADLNHYAEGEMQFVDDSFVLSWNDGLACGTLTSEALSSGVLTMYSSQLTGTMQYAQVDPTGDWAVFNDYMDLEYIFALNLKNPAMPTQIQLPVDAGYSFAGFGPLKVRGDYAYVYYFVQGQDFESRYIKIHLTDQSVETLDVWPELGNMYARGKWWMMDEVDHYGQYANSDDGFQWHVFPSLPRENSTVRLITETAVIGWSDGNYAISTDDAVTWTEMDAVCLNLGVGHFDLDLVALGENYWFNRVFLKGVTPDSCKLNLNLAENTTSTIRSDKTVILRIHNPSPAKVITGSGLVLDYAITFNLSDCILLTSCVIGGDCQNLEQRSGSITCLSPTRIFNSTLQFVSFSNSSLITMFDCSVMSGSINNNQLFRAFGTSFNYMSFNPGSASTPNNLLVSSRLLASATPTRASWPSWLPVPCRRLH